MDYWTIQLTNQKKSGNWMFPVTEWPVTDCLLYFCNPKVRHQKFVNIQKLHFLVSGTQRALITCHLKSDSVFELHLKIRTLRCHSEIHLTTRQLTIHHWNNGLVSQCSNPHQKLLFKMLLPSLVQKLHTCFKNDQFLGVFSGIFVTPQLHCKKCLIL